MEGWLGRTELLIGSEAVDKLNRSTVAVVGLGGVGGAAAEALCRSGIGHLILMDHDVFDVTNLNRQILSTAKNIGLSKTTEAAKRMRLINPSVRVTELNQFYGEDTSDILFSHHPDFILDAIDTVTGKLHLITAARQRNIPVLSCMGTGNRFDPEQLTVTDIAKTSGCGLARVMRKELRRRDILHLPVVFSGEKPVADVIAPDSREGRHSPGSISFVPPVAGYLMASYAVRCLIGMIQWSED